MSGDHKIPRLFLAADLAARAEADLDKAQAHYLGNVMRLQPGDKVMLFNGRDGEFVAEIIRAGKSGGSVRLLEQSRAPQPEPDIWLLFAPLKKDATDFIVEKATELGVSALYPVFTRRTAAMRANVERMTANAVEAAEQCERMTLPRVFEPRNLDQVLAEWDPARRLFFMDETGGGEPIARALAGAKAGPAAILVGPEGGFHQTELDALRQSAFSTGIGLGPRILRAETAALAALAVFQALQGDWSKQPAFRSTD